MLAGVQLQVQPEYAIIGAVSGGRGPLATQHATEGIHVAETFELPTH